MINIDDKNFQDVKVAETIRHPLYINEKYHDIGLLRLETPVNMNPGIRPACLYTERQLPMANATALGWGVINNNREFSKDLLKVGLEFFDVDECNSTFRGFIKAPGSTLRAGITDDSMVCAGSRTEFRDTCEVRFEIAQ